MLNNEKTREGVVRFTGSGTENLEKGCWGEDTALPRAFQEKCVRCPYSPGGDHACNLVPCPFSGRHDGEGLTSAGVSGKVSFPNLDRRSNRLSILPKNRKSIAAYSAVEAPAVSSGLLSHIGRVQRLHVREAVAAYLGPGSVVPCLFYFPNLEVPHD